MGMAYSKDFVGPGFEFRVADKNGPAFITVHSWSPELDEVMEHSGVHDVTIYQWSGSNNSSPECLVRYAEQIHRLQVVDENVRDVSFVSRLVNLQEFTRWGSIAEIDFSPLRRLRKCSIRKSQGLSNLAACRSLRWLSVEGARVADLAIFSPLPKLEFLAIGSAPLRSLVHINQLPSLRRFQVQECRRFTSLAGIEATRIEELFLAWLPQLGSIAPASQLPTLRDLRVHSCHRVTDLEALGALTTLELLILTGRQQLPSLAFLRRLHHLREFRCGEMKILDGNLEVLLTLPHLETVVIAPARKHYSHTGQELMQILQDRRQRGEET